MLEKCVLTILELNWNQRLGHKKTKLNICHHMLSSPTQLQNRSFHVVERTRTSSKCQKMKNARAKRTKNTVFHCQICKFVGFLLPSSSWLLKLSIISTSTALLPVHLQRALSTIKDTRQKQESQNSHHFPNYFQVTFSLPLPLLLLKLHIWDF